MRNFLRFSWGCAAGLLLLFSMTLNANPQAVGNAMVIFGDSLSDTGNTTHLLKSLRREESPAYLVRPLKIFVIHKMADFADDYYVPQIILDSGIEIVSRFFDQDVGPLLASIVEKVKRVPVLPGEPYWQNHFSNGRVWSEYLAPMLHIDREDAHVFTDQAFGGSWAVTYDHQLTLWNLIKHPIESLKALVVGKLIPPSLGLSVQGYLLSNPALNDNTIYFMFSGGNDYLNLFRFSANYDSEALSAYIDNILSSMEYSVKKLVAAGAKHIIVLGVPEVGYAPRFNQSADKNLLNAAVQLHNQRLSALVDSWQQEIPQADFLFISVQPALEKALNNPAEFGLTNTVDACIDIKLPVLKQFSDSVFAGNYVLQYLQVLHYRDASFAPGETNYHVCENPDSYLFWDEVHPTTVVHRYLAYEICGAMKAHGYPADCQFPLTN